MKIAVIGADGQLGSDIVAACRADGHEVVPLTIAQVDITDDAQVQRVLAGSGAGVIVNTAAMHQVEKCEADPARAFAVNALGARHLAVAANANGARLVHISTDYVFDGAKLAPYLESDCPLPLNAYGNSKLAGELFVRAGAEKHYVLRVSGLYGIQSLPGEGRAELCRPDAQAVARAQGSARGRRRDPDAHLDPEVARQLLHMLKAGAADGLYHATAEGNAPGMSSPPRSSA